MKKFILALIFIILQANTLVNAQDPYGTTLNERQAEYLVVDINENQEMLVFNNEGKRGVINSNGEIITEFIDFIEEPIEGFDPYHLNGFHLFDDDVDNSLDASIGVEYISSEEYGDMLKINDDFYIVSNNQYKQGVVNKDLELIIDMEYEMIFLIEDKFICLNSAKNSFGKDITYYTTSGRFIKKLDAWEGNCYDSAFIPTLSIGAIKGDPNIDYEYLKNEMTVPSFGVKFNGEVSDYAIIEKHEQYKVLQFAVDIDANEIPLNEDYYIKNSYIFFEDGQSSFRDNFGKYGMINDKFEVIIEPKSDRPLNHLVDDLYVVQIGSFETIYDAKNDKLFDYYFTEVHYMVGDKILVTNDWYAYLVTKDGKILNEDASYRRIEKIGDYYLVQVLFTYSTGHFDINDFMYEYVGFSYGLLDENGVEIVPPIYLDIFVSGDTIIGNRISEGYTTIGNRVSEAENFEINSYYLDILDYSEDIHIERVVTELDNRQPQEFSVTKTHFEDRVTGEITEGTMNTITRGDDVFYRLKDITDKTNYDVSFDENTKEIKISYETSDISITLKANSHTAFIEIDDVSFKVILKNAPINYNGETYLEDIVFIDWLNIQYNFANDDYIVVKHYKY